MPIDSPAYTAFLDDYLHANTWSQRKDGCPLDLLDALTPQEKTRAESELLMNLSLGDSWPIEGLGHLKSKAALPRLRQMLPSAQNSIIAYVALAIWKIDRDPTMCGITIKASIDFYTDDERSSNTFTMTDIIYCLAQFPLPEALERLKELEKSSNSLISYNAERLRLWFTPK
jgi:hypothetical protein